MTHNKLFINACCCWLVWRLSISFVCLLRQALFFFSSFPFNAFPSFSNFYRAHFMSHPVCLLFSSSCSKKIQKRRELVPSFFLLLPFLRPSHSCVWVRVGCALFHPCSPKVSICLIQPTTTTMITTNKNKQGQIHSQQLLLLLLLYHHPNTPICLIEI